MGFVRETPPSAGQVIILNNLSVKSSLFTDKLSILSQPFTVIRFHGGKQDSLTPQKTKHPCRLTEVSEAEQPHRPLQIVRLPRIIRLTQSSSTSHVSKGCTQMSFTATRLPPWGLAALGTRGRRLRSRRAWSSRRLLVAGLDHFGKRKFITTSLTTHWQKIKGFKTNFKI